MLRVSMTVAALLLVACGDDGGGTGGGGTGGGSNGDVACTGDGCSCDVEACTCTAGVDCKEECGSTDCSLTCDTAAKCSANGTAAVHLTCNDDSECKGSGGDGSSIVCDGASKCELKAGTARRGPAAATPRASWTSASAARRAVKTPRTAT